jgi:anti-sigma factor RsiW
MRLVEPAELSAYLDGELDPDRARELAAALAEDADLRAAYEALANSDKSWQLAAAAASFKPAIDLSSHENSRASRLTEIMVVAVLVALCVMSKTTDAITLGLILHGIALAIALPWIVRMAREDQNQL